jgi:tellurite resistance protein TehA-like permease
MTDISTTEFFSIFGLACFIACVSVIAIRIVRWILWVNEWVERWERKWRTEK